MKLLSRDGFKTAACFSPSMFFDFFLLGEKHSAVLELSLDNNFTSEYLVFPLVLLCETSNTR